jgi:hypothetical protein
MEMQLFHMTRRRMICAGFALAGASVHGVAPAAAETGGLPNILAHDGERLMKILASLPYVAEGSGLPVYVLMSQTCPYCKALWKIHKTEEAKIQLRWIPAPVGQDNIDQIAHVLKTRKLTDFEQYMARTLPAGNMQQDGAKVKAFNNLVDMVTIIYQLIRKNGLRTGTPNIFWEKAGVVENISGFSESEFRAMVRRLST